MGHNLSRLYSDTSLLSLMDQAWEVTSTKGVAAGSLQVVFFKRPVSKIIFTVCINFIWYLSVRESGFPFPWFALFFF